MPSPTSKTQEIDALRQRYQELDTKRIQAQTRLEETRRQLKVMEEEAVKQWGTADLVELQKKLASQQEENERLRLAYQASLATIEEGLKKLETTKVN
jgi:hypothetical protein